MKVLIRNVSCPESQVENPTSKEIIDSANQNTVEALSSNNVVVSQNERMSFDASENNNEEFENPESNNSTFIESDGGSEYSAECIVMKVMCA